MRAVAVVIIGGLFLLAGCKKDAAETPPTPPPGVAPVAPSAPAPGKAKNPMCVLFTAEQLNKLTGLAFEEGQPNDSTNCGWNVAGSSGGGFTLNLFTSNIDQVWTVLGDGAAVPDIGDKAAFNATTRTLAFRKGGKMINLNLNNSVITEAHAKAIAKAAADQL